MLRKEIVLIYVESDLLYSFWAFQSARKSDSILDHIGLMRYKYTSCEQVVC
jgi:hypothetical protein